MAQEYKLILKYADEPGYTPDVECYVRHGGYEPLKKALAMKPKDLPDGKKFRPRSRFARTSRSPDCAAAAARAFPAG